MKYVKLFEEFVSSKMEETAAYDEIEKLEQALMDEKDPEKKKEIEAKLLALTDAAKDAESEEVKEMHDSKLHGEDEEES